MQLRTRFALLVVSLSSTLFWLNGARSDAQVAAAVYPPLVNQSADFDQPLAVLSSLEQLAFSADWQPAMALTLPEGGHAAVLLASNSARQCLPVSSPDVSLTSWVLPPSTLPTASSEATPVGVYYDILLPFNAHSCRQSAYRLVEWKPRQAGSVQLTVGDATVEVVIHFKGQFSTPERPMLIGLSNSYLIKGHCQSYCRREATLGQAYAQILESHHLTPIQAWVQRPPIKPDGLLLDYAADSQLSHRQRAWQTKRWWLDFPRLPQPEQAQRYLAALQQTIEREKLQGRAWVYVRDEPADREALITELTLYRQHAPAVQTMVTTPYHPSLEGLVDIYAPNLLQWEPDNPGYRQTKEWPYVSCMGSCGPNGASPSNLPRKAGPETGLPDFLIDRPAARLTQYFKQLDDAQADGGLYYHAVEGYPLSRRGQDPLTDPWNFGGNGDGLLLYPGRPGEAGLISHQPLPSFRLKLMRQAIETYWQIAE